MLPIKDFVMEIYRAGNITTAANNPFISQPALSADLKRLENELGVVLFDRSTSPITPTDAGRAYIHALSKIHNISNELESYLNDVKGLQAGHFSVGGAHFVASCLLLNLTRDFRKQYSGITVDIFEDNSAALAQRVLQDEIDLLLDYDADRTLFTSTPILREHILLCVPCGHARLADLAGIALTRNDVIADCHHHTSPVDLSIFAEDNFIMMRKGNNMFEHAGALCHRAGFQPRVVLAFDQLVTAYEAAVKGLGVTFVSDEMVKTISDNGDAVFFTLAGEDAQRMLYLSAKRGRYLGKAVETFIDFARQYHT